MSSLVEWSPSSVSRVYSMRESLATKGGGAFCSALAARTAHWEVCVTVGTSGEKASRRNDPLSLLPGVRSY